MPPINLFPICRVVHAAIGSNHGRGPGGPQRAGASNAAGSCASVGRLVVCGPSARPRASLALFFSCRKNPGSTTSAVGAPALASGRPLCLCRACYSAEGQVGQFILWVFQLLLPWQSVAGRDVQFGIVFFLAEGRVDTDDASAGSSNLGSSNRCIFPAR